MKDIVEALGQLDTLDDSQWTADGMPKLEGLKATLGRDVSRKEVTDAAPLFSRENPILETDEEIALTDPDGAVEETGPAEHVDLSELKSVSNLSEFLLFMKTVPTSQLRDLEETVQEAQRELIRHRDRLAEADRLMQAALGHTQSRISFEIPAEDETTANQNYLKAQAELREKRKAAQNALLAGIDLSNIDPRAPIDRAFARRTGRGGQRPTRG